MNRRALALTLPLVMLVSAGLRADVTITNTITITGPVAAMLGGTPQMVMRIKGSRARMDVEVMNQKMSNIIDLDTKQVTTLIHAQKTAQVADVGKMASQISGGGTQPPAIDAQIQPTGRTQDISGQQCAEYKYSMSLDMATIAANASAMAAAGGGAQMPPDMFKDLKMVMTGSVWVAKDGPGIAEYSAFTKAAQRSMISLSPFGAGGSMQAAPGLGDMMKTFSQLDGLTYLAEIDMSFEGTNPMIEMLKTMGAMKITTKVTDVSVAPVSDEHFQIPSDYTVAK
jgi:hypothetical protein